MARQTPYTRLDYTRLSSVQRLTQMCIRAVMGLLVRMQVEGQDRLLRSGPLLAASNHLHLLDFPLLMTLAPRPVVCLISVYWKTVPLLGWLLTHVGNVIYVKRKQGTARALVDCLRVLRAGGIVGITPEGGISQSRSLTDAYAGIAYLATRGSAPVLPVVIYGQERAVSCWKRLRRAPVTVRIGPPIVLPAGKTRKDELRIHTDDIMATLARLLPPEYRGQYAAGK